MVKHALPRSPPILDAGEILTRLAELGPPSELRAQAPALAARSLSLDRVLLSAVAEGCLTAESFYAGEAPAGAAVLSELRSLVVALEYPLTEGEILRRRRAQVVRAPADGSPARHAFAQVMGWREYVAAPIVLDGAVIGFFHGDRLGSGEPVQDADAAALASFASCFAVVYERAVLRHRLRVQREELRRIASWADARTSELGDRGVTLASTGGVADDETAPAQRAGPVGRGELRDLLTRRELEVLELMVRGETNGGIARELVVSEGTVKFHVKNILRKLHASNRADATSRYLRLTLPNGERGRGPSAG